MEIKEAMFNIDAIKSPGTDGLNAVFYQSQWEHVGGQYVILLSIYGLIHLLLVP